MLKLVPFLTSVVFFATRFSGIRAQNCEAGWQEFGGKCYTVGDDSIQSWHDARLSCLGWGGDLVSVHDDNENEFVYNLTNSSIYSGPLWIGLNQLGNRQDYRWSDGTNMVPVYEGGWANGQPPSTGLSQCAYTPSRSSISKGIWSTANCGQPYGFVCKKLKGAGPINPVPTPTVPGYCPEGYYGIGNKCFKYFHGDHLTGVNMTTAMAICRSQPGVLPDLASINSREENEVIVAQILGDYLIAWIGMTKLNGYYYWTDNSNTGYVNWDTNEPSADALSVCGSVMPPDGAWNNEQCQNYRGYVCQTYKDTDNVISTPQPTPFQCPPDYAPYWYACYKRANGSMTWDQADAMCRAEGAQLASIHSDPENAAVHLFSEALAPLWIGLRKNSEDDPYTWTDLWPVEYTYWDTNEPGGGEGCVSMDANGGWNDRACDEFHGAICKTTDAPPPTRPPDVEGSCVPGWLPHGEYCYLFHTSYYSWGTARTTCESYRDVLETDVTLASVHDYFENDFILYHLNTTATIHAWLGMRKEPAVGGEYVWVDGTPVNYQRWSPGEPNDLNGTQICAQMYMTGYAGRWNDHDCNEANRFVCKARKALPPTSPPFPPDAGGRCPSDAWGRMGTNCYLYVPDHWLLWSEAQAECKALGGQNAYLATIGDSTENWLIWQRLMIGNQVPTRATSWIGLYKMGTGYPYEWLDGTALNFTAWAAGEPSPDDPRTNCVEIDHVTGEWRDVACGDFKGFACKVKQDTSQEYGSNEGLSSGDVAAIILGVLFALLLLGCAAYALYRFCDDKTCASCTDRLNRLSCDCFGFLRKKPDTIRFDDDNMSTVSGASTNYGKGLAPPPPSSQSAPVTSSGSQAPPAAPPRRRAAPEAPSSPVYSAPFAAAETSGDLYLEPNAGYGHPRAAYSSVGAKPAAESGYGQAGKSSHVVGNPFANYGYDNDA